MKPTEREKKLEKKLRETYHKMLSIAKLINSSHPNLAEYMFQECHRIDIVLSSSGVRTVEHQQATTEIWKVLKAAR